jgi:hypothetical protein
VYPPHSDVLSIVFVHVYFTKIFRGVKGFERKTETPHPSAVERVGSPQTRSRRAGVDLTHLEHEAEVWYGIISIGTPAKSFAGTFLRAFMTLVHARRHLLKVQFDTGSRQVFFVSAIHSLLLLDPATSLFQHQLVIITAEATITSGIPPRPQPPRPSIDILG